MTEMIENLSIINKHERDEHIIFEEKSHKYTITTDLDSKYTSVTSWLHEHFEPFDADKIINNMMKKKNWPSSSYYGKTIDEIKEQWNQNGKEVTKAGTDLHKNIECFMNFEIENPTHETLYEYYQQDPTIISNDSIEWGYFINFIKFTPNLKPFRSEWTIYNEDVKISGSVDMVYEEPDGNLLIYDWKRCKEITKSGWNKFSKTECIEHIPDTNFWHYTLQLNMYKKIIELKYGRNVTKICLVKLHPLNSTKTFEIISLPILTDDIDNLFEYRKQLLKTNESN